MEAVLEPVSPLSVSFGAHALSSGTFVCTNSVNVLSSHGNGELWPTKASKRRGIMYSG